jgi:hypothetical protein
VLAEYEAHYNENRPHRTLDQRPMPQSELTATGRIDAAVERTDILGGLIHEYRPAS